MGAVPHWNVDGQAAGQANGRVDLASPVLDLTHPSAFLRLCGSLMTRFGLAACLALTAPLPALELTPLEDGTAAQLTTLGNMELGQGRYETAIQLFQKALATDRTYFYARFNLALAHQLLGRSEEARQWYQEALKASPDHPEVLCNLGYLSFQAGDFADAASKFQDAARLAGHGGSEASQFWFNAGTARERLGQWSEAARAYQEALALDPKLYGAHFNLGTLYLTGLADQPGALDKALGQLQAAVDTDPARPEGWLNLSQAHELAGRGEPLADLDQALAAASGPYAGQLNAVRWQRALFFKRAQPPQMVAMREELKRILADDQNYSGANSLMGSYLYALGEFEAATAHLEREVAPGHDDPKDPRKLDAHFLLAVIYAEHRIDPAKAIAHATAYYQARPDSPRIHELRRRALRLAAAAGVSVQGEGVSPATGASSDHTPTGHSGPSPDTTGHGAAEPAGETGHGTTQASPAPPHGPTSHEATPPGHSTAEHH